MRDAAGLTSTAQITVTIQGANDAPSDLAIANPNGTNLITNGSFETNNGAANTVTWGPTVTASGWTAIGGQESKFGTTSTMMDRPLQATVSRDWNSMFTAR